MTPPLVALVLLSLIPLLSAVTRLFDLATGARALAGHERFAADPLAGVLHVVGGTAFATLGVLQFIPALRRSPWHRRLGRVLAVLGVGAAGAGLWMDWRWPARDFEGPLVEALRVVVGVAMVVLIVGGVAAARRGDVPGHEASLTRAYALWAAGGTQAFTLAPFFVEELAPWRSEALYAALLALGWGLNLVLAEVALRGRTRPAGVTS